MPLGRQADLEAERGVDEVEDRFNVGLATGTASSRPSPKSAGAVTVD